jgi:hypothetical protein
MRAAFLPERAGGDQSQLRRSMLFVLLVTIKCRAIQQQITIRFIPPAIVRRNWRRAQQPWCSFPRWRKHSCYMEKAVGTNILSPCRSNKFFGFLVPWDFFLSCIRRKGFPLAFDSIRLESLSVTRLLRPLRSCYANDFVFKAQRTKLKFN